MYMRVHMWDAAPAVGWGPLGLHLHASSVRSLEKRSAVKRERLFVISVVFVPLSPAPFKELLIRKYTARDQPAV